MFDHLDDPAPPTVPHGFEAAVAARRTQRARRRHAGYAAVAAGVAAVLAFVGISLGANGGHSNSVKVIGPSTSTSTSVVTTPPSTTPSTTATTLPTPTTVPVRVAVTIPAATTTTVPAGQPLVCGAAKSSATSGPVTYQVSDGGYTVTLTGQLSNGGWTSGTVVATYQGRTVVDHAVSMPPYPGELANIPLVLAPVGPGSVDAASDTTESPLCIGYFQGSSTPAATIRYFSNGGASSCCSEVQSFPLTPTGGSLPVDLFEQQAAGALTQSGDASVLESGDYNFIGEFNDNAQSGEPIQLYTLNGGQFVKVTSQYPSLVETDAALWWRYWQNSPGAGLAFLANWVADESVIGQATSAWNTVQTLETEGKLTSTGGGTWPTGAAYVSALRTFIAQQGY
jgi:hypothetical protein